MRNTTTTTKYTKTKRGRTELWGCFSSASHSFPYSSSEVVEEEELKSLAPSSISYNSSLFFSLRLPFRLPDFPFFLRVFRFKIFVESLSSSLDFRLCLCTSARLAFGKASRLPCSSSCCSTFLSWAVGWRDAADSPRNPSSSESKSRSEAE